MWFWFLIRLFSRIFRKLAVEKAYAENPEIYAYDEEYDNFKKKSKKTEEQEKADEEKKVNLQSFNIFDWLFGGIIDVVF